ncbi:hypothetical protein HPB50_018134 [Hyalomma asiaticum]|uniref:Uncharacterized protein n=1 Tax=Hyalomma asiaticum TaxID=266040 RepID=A0ACB7T3E3_HYAAI|nr:hypothetical protein HPB50_018134 [Hyalomma asiaticum]
MSVRAPPGPNVEYDHNRVLTWLQDWMSVSTNEEENLGPPPMNHYATISSLGHRSVRSAPRDYVDPDYVRASPANRAGVVRLLCVVVSYRVRNMQHQQQQTRRLQPPAAVLVGVVYIDVPALF